jgi:predicted amidophosphoribosyltransferase
MSDYDDERTCPHCHSDIPAEATVCRYCGRSSDPQSQIDFDRNVTRGVWIVLGLFVLWLVFG